MEIALTLRSAQGSISKEITTTIFVKIRRRENKMGFDDEDMYDQVTGNRRSSVKRMLNKQKLSKHEMDDIFWIEGDVE